MDEEKIKYDIKYEVADKVLLKKTTPDKIQTKTETYDITAIQKELLKCQGALSIWQGKVDALQAILDKYTELAPVVEVVEPVIKTIKE